VRKNPQPFELSNSENFCEKSPSHKVSANADNLSTDPDLLSESEREADKSQSLKRAMAEVDRLFPQLADSPSSKQAEKEVHQIGLEDELVSSIHADAGSLFMPDLRDEGRLQVASNAVDDECSNLIDVCHLPDEGGDDVLDDSTNVSRPKVSVMALGKGTERIGGILAEQKHQAAVTSHKSKIVFASLIVPAISVALFAYFNPQKAMQLAQRVKTDWQVTQHVSAIGDYLSLTKMMADDNSVAEAADEPAQPLKITRLSGIPVRSSTYALNRVNIGITQVAQLADLHPEAGLSVNSHQPSVRRNIAVVKDDVVSGAGEMSVLSQRFDQNASPELNQKIMRVIAAQAVSEPINKTPPVSRQSAQNRADKEEIATTGRDLQSLQRVVTLANVGEVLDSAQLKTFVHGLAQGECVSEALHGVVGENKISPVFVRALMKHMDQRC